MPDGAFAQQFLAFLNVAKGAFHDARTRGRVREMGVASIVAACPKTITSLLEFNGKHGDPSLNHGDWSSSYRMLSTGKWEMRDVSWRLLDMALQFLGGDEPVMLAVDDTILRKRGLRVNGCAYCRDPLSPPFQTNLVWGQRMLCVSMLVRSSGTSAYRSVPLFFELTPSVKIPSKATEEERRLLTELRKKSKMSVAGRKLVDGIRRRLDDIGMGSRKMIVSADGSFANRSFLYAPPHDTVFVCRCRNDLKLFAPLREAEKRGKRLYGRRLDTPAAFNADGGEPASRLECGCQHQHARISYKSMEDVRWPTALKNQPCSVFAIKGQYYRKYGKRQHKEPAFLVVTGDAGIASAEGRRTGGVCIDKILEAYLLRWEIEVGFRDQKNWLGIGKAQVRNSMSVRRTPAFMSACYSMLLMSSMKVYDDKRTDDFKPLPKWRSIAPLRPSIRDLVELLRAQVLAIGRVTA